MDYLFDFDAWLISNDLKHVKQVFVDHNMYSPQTINFHSKYFSKLITDSRITSKPELNQKIISAVQTLTNRNNNQQSTALLSNTENNGILQIQFYMKNMREIENQFRDLTLNYRNKCKKDQQEINRYIHFLKHDLNTKNQEIEEIFDDLLNALTNKRQELMNKIENNLPKEFNKYQIKHNDITTLMNNKIIETKNMIQNELNHIKQQENHCKQLILDSNKHLSVRSNLYKAERENKIIHIVDQTRICHQEIMHSVRENIHQINGFLNRNIAFQVDINDSSMNKNIYQILKQDKYINSIKRNLKKCVDIYYSIQNESEESVASDCYDTESDNSSNLVQKKKQKRRKRMTKQLKKEISSLNDQIQNASKSFDDLRDLKDAEITTLKNEIALLQQQLVATSNAKLNIEDEMKLLSIKIDKFEGRMGNDDASNMKYINKWDGFYLDNDKWKLLNNRQKLQGIWPKESKYFCAFLDFNSSRTNGGIYSCSIKWEAPNDRDGKTVIPASLKASCCLGISILRDVKVIKNGVKWSNRWPKWAGNKSNSSHFDSTSEEPCWYVNEVITIKLDLDNSMIYYFKDNKLIKKETIHEKLPCYVMLCACPNITGEFCYSIVNPVH